MITDGIIVNRVLNHRVSIPIEHGLLSSKHLIFAAEPLVIIMDEQDAHADDLGYNFPHRNGVPARTQR